MNSVSLERFKRSLTLQVFIKQGPFWMAVAQLRGKWEIQAPSMLPWIAEAEQNMKDNEDQLIWKEYYERWKRSPTKTRGYLGSPPIPVSAPGPYDWRLPTASGVSTNRADQFTDEGNHHRLHDWSSDIQRLYWHYVPDSLRTPGLDPYGWSAWSEFLQFCVLYDPPDMDLDAFAAGGGPYFAEFKDSKGNLVSNPPIVQRYEAMAEHLAVAGAYESLLKELDSRFLRPRGLDLAQMRKELYSNGFSLFEEIQAYLGSEPIHLYIDVDVDTRETDVRRAFSVISAGREKQPNLKVRDSLDAVQCAVLSDQYGWTHKQIAERFQWRLTPDEIGTPRRSDRVADHIALGREILKGKLPAP